MAAEALGRQASWPVKAAAAVALLNLFDCLFTLAFLQLGLCEEANPLMRALYLASPWMFAAFKLLCVNSGLVLLMKLRARPLARAALALASCVYVALAAYELHALVAHAAAS